MATKVLRKKKKKKSGPSPATMIAKHIRGEKLTPDELKIIATSASHSVQYADEICGRFLEGEKTIAASEWASEYISNHVKGRWDQEDIFFKTRCAQIKLDKKRSDCLCPNCCGAMESLISYCEHHRGRWDKMEEYLPRISINSCATYHEKVMKCERWPEYEEKLKTYKGRDTGLWTGVEFLEILKEYMSRTQWEDGKDLLLAYGDVQDCIQFVEKNKKPWPELEMKFCAYTKNQEYQYFWEGCDYWRNLRLYLKNVGQAAPLEDLMLHRARPKVLLEYSIDLGHRLPNALHQKMILTSFKGKSKYVSRYFRYLKRQENRVRGFLKSLDTEELREFLCSVTNSDAA